MQIKKRMQLRGADGTHVDARRIKSIIHIEYLRWWQMIWPKWSHTHKVESKVRMLYEKYFFGGLLLLLNCTADARRRSDESHALYTICAHAYHARGVTYPTHTCIYIRLIEESQLFSPSYARSRQSKSFLRKVPNIYIYICISRAQDVRPPVAPEIYKLMRARWEILRLQVIKNYYYLCKFTMLQFIFLFFKVEIYRVYKRSYQVLTILLSL